MKDAKGHGSDPRGGAAHHTGVNEVGRTPLPSPQNAANAQQPQGHWFDPRKTDEYVYHGTDMEHIEGIKREGLQAFRRNYFATDPKIAMRYGYRPNIHHTTAGASPEHPSGVGKRPGVLLRVHKSVVDSEGYQNERRAPWHPREDFWTGPGDIKPEHIEMRHKGQWKKIT